MGKARDEKSPEEQNKETLDKLVEDAGGEEVLKDAPDQVKTAVADLEIKDDALNPDDKAAALTEDQKFGDVQNDKAAHGADEDKVELVDDEDNDPHILGKMHHGLQHFDDEKAADDFSDALDEEEVLARQNENFDEDSSDIEGDGFTVHPPIPSENIEFEPEEDVRAVLHGSHSAAMGGLQTDASGSYTPPGLINQPAAGGSTFKQQ